MIVSRYWLVSCFVHALLVMVLLWHYQSSRAGKNALLTLDAYVFQPKMVSQPQTVRTTLAKTDDLHVDKATHWIPRKNRGMTVNRKNQPQKNLHSTENISAFSTGEQNELLERLHQLIAEKERYPDEASLLGQRGKVTVGFTLTPAGDVTAIQIVQSSGFHDLDQAALESVQAISPFVNARHYLNANKYFSVDIEFTT